jgi:hypothetical protein
MLASNRTTDTIAFFVGWVRDASLVVWPAVIMTDCDHAQMNALRLVYPDSQMLLCKWHVLHAMRSHFNTSEFPELWAKVKAFTAETNFFSACFTVGIHDVMTSFSQ